MPAAQVIGQSQVESALHLWGATCSCVRPPRQQVPAHLPMQRQERPPSGQTVHVRCHRWQEQTAMGQTVPGHHHRQQGHPPRGQAVVIWRSRWRGLWDGGQQALNGVRPCSGLGCVVPSERQEAAAPAPGRPHRLTAVPPRCAAGAAV